MHALRGSEPVYHHVGRVIYNGSMPFQTLTTPPVEPLSEQEKQIILDWVKAGAPKGSCEVPTAPSASASAVTRRRPPAEKRRSAAENPAPPAASAD